MAGEARVSYLMAAAIEKGVRVFVHLGHGFGASSWRRRLALGLIPGVNDSFAYGYHRASGDGWIIEYSEDAVENSISRLCRLILRKLLGFDLLHAWRNRKGLFAADIVWTHTEFENLAVLTLLLTRARRSRPKIIANCVWLFDRWNNLPWPRRAVYRRLLQDADAITTFSLANLEIAKKIFPGRHCEYVAWGATIDELRQPNKKVAHRPIRLASLGSDMHRDWETLVRAFGNRHEYQVKIGARKVDPRLVANLDNIALLSPRTASEVRALYEWADIVVVSLKPNLHASGITVIQESVILGIAVVCTDSGGLQAYFSSAEVRYVPPNAPVAMRHAVEELARNGKWRSQMIANAQRRLIQADLTTKGFAERHRRLSESLLSGFSKCPISDAIQLRG